MHIVMLSDLEIRGGAAVAAGRLADAFCRRRHRVTRIVARRDGNGHAWTTRVLWPSLFRWGMRRVMPAEAWRHFNISALNRQFGAMLTRLKPDVIDVHNLHGMTWAGWGLDLVRVCVEHAPTVWTLHDMWSFTGRCAYSYDCEKFKTGCNDTCPTPTEYPALAPSEIAGAWQKRRIMSGALPNLVAVIPSKWLKQQAQSGLWSGHRIEVIPNGLPLDIYRPVDRVLARSELGLEPNGPVLMISAFDLAERRKGGNLLVHALRGVSQRPLTLITLGLGKLDCDIAGINVRPLGYVEDERTRVMAYNAADLYVHPAQVDNLPNTVMEALACGTPTVAFPIGGVPEMVRLGQTGWLADCVSGESLARVLDDALTQVAGGNTLRETCRTVAQSEYGADLQATRYESLFQSLLAGGL